MNITKMLNFITVYECGGNITKASEKLFCTQPALSKQMNSLETELGYQLFDRVGKKMYINENGIIFYRFAKNVINDYTLLKRELYLKNNENEHEVRFGTTNFIGTYMLPVILSQFKNKYPTTPVNFIVDYLPNIMDQLNKDVINFAIIPEDDAELDTDKYIFEEFAEDEFVLIFPVDHPLAQKEEIYIEDIVNYQFLISNEQSATRKFITRSLDNHHVKLNNTINMNNIYMIRESILNGLGISIYSKSAIKKDEELGLLKSAHIKDIKLHRKLYIAYKKKHTFLEDEARFIKYFVNNTIL